ncbi:MAG: tetratricopeptide repeat protein, partial [Candidatus Dormibacteraeota bacterium]|nr:tetratricopeptide repeat protein [Candidatus Dormibacteraeota bacterium]
GLLEEAGEDRAGQPRYRFHSLVRAFARECLLSTEPAGGRKAALVRALTAQLSLAELARSMVAPGDAKEAPSQATPRWQPDSQSIVEQVEGNALEWLEAERTNLIVATRQASQADLPDLAWELACVLPTFLALRGYWQDWRATKELALEANRRAGNQRGEAHMLWSLGESLLGLRDIVGARNYFSQSLALYRDISDSHGERHTLLALGFVEMFAGNLEVAFERLDTCRLLCAEAGERHSEAVALTGLAGIQRSRADNVEAAARLRRSLGVFQEDRDRYWEATVLRLLGEVHMADGLGHEAAICFEQALKIFRDFGDRYLEARVLYSMAELQLAAGRGQDAAAHLESCVAIYHELNLGHWQARALKRLHDAHRSLTRA